MLETSFNTFKQFVVYSLYILANGDDLDVWTIDELNENLEKYKHHQIPSAQPLPPGATQSSNSSPMPGQVLPHTSSLVIHREKT